MVQNLNGCLLAEIRIGKRVKVTGPPNNECYGKVTKYLRNSNWEVVEYKVLFEDKRYGTSDWFPVSQVKEVT
jgi:hypothetical protein